MLAPSIPSHVLYRQTLNRMGWSMMFFVLVFNIFNVIPSVVSEALNLIPSTAWSNVFTALYGILSAVCYMLPFFLTGLLYYAISRRTRPVRASLEVRLPAEFPLLIFAGIAILTAAAYINSWFCNIIGYSIPAEMVTLAENYDNPTTVILYMSIALAPAFAEEFLFRGVFYANLRPYGRTQAILISALLFALMHQNIGQLFYTFVAGIAMALMYELTGSIWCSVIYHLFNNQLSVISEVLNGRYGSAVHPHLSILDGIILLLGIISIVLLVRYYAKQSVWRKQTRTDGIVGAQSERIQPYDQPLIASAVLKGALTPGMIAFTLETFANMVLVWVFLAIMNGGNLW